VASVEEVHQRNNLLWHKTHHLIKKSGDLIIAKINVNSSVVWTESVVTDDAIESVFGARDELCRQAVEIAEAKYDYKSSAEEAELYGGLIVTPA
jgi:hypothetical protein